VRAALHDEVGSIATAVAAAHQASASVTINRGPPPIVNPERESGWAREAAERVLGAGSVVPFGVTNMGGEDFACYLERTGGCFPASERVNPVASRHQPTARGSWRQKRVSLWAQRYSRSARGSRVRICRSSALDLND
jgi:metal-dependent amidase/aminoacylase/carboxypeptidase family protein